LIFTFIKLNALIPFFFISAYSYEEIKTKISDGIKHNTIPTSFLYGF